MVAFANVKMPYSCALARYTSTKGAFALHVRAASFTYENVSISIMNMNITIYHTEKSKSETFLADMSMQLMYARGLQ